MATTMTVGDLRRMLEGVPDDFKLRATGVEGPKVVPVSGTPEPEDREFVLYLEANEPSHRDIGTYLVVGR